MAKPDKQSFVHRHAAHCESGVMALMLTHHGLKLSEAMAFGLSGALMFAYIPFVRLGGLPLVAYRRLPKAIIKGLRKNLKLEMRLETFSVPERGMQVLDELLARGEIVGLQSSVFWLPYFPENMRFHFNAHNLIALAKADDQYYISDPVFEEPVHCGVRDLERARFVKGVMAPKGFLYYPLKVPASIAYERIIPQVVRKTAKAMLKNPVPIAGIRGMRTLATAIYRLKDKEERYARLFLGHIVRMQEEIGTGGAGFRYIYASFLQEAGLMLGNRHLQEGSEIMTSVGDQWREFAYIIAKSIRSKRNSEIDFSGLKEKLESIAVAETEVYRELLDCRT